jgi:putative hydroxymethylpyrimidine transport system ATP-binding protein
VYIEPANPSFSVAITGAAVGYGGVPLFAGLELTLAARSWTCLLGPSGIGKTSLLRLVLGLPVGDAHEGRIECSDSRSLAGRTSYLAQRDLLLPWLNALDNVTLGRRLRRERTTVAATDWARSLLEAVGLAGCEAMRPDQLSAGMRQRVALARILFEDRPVVVMDEPFTSVDVLTKIRLETLAAGLLAGRTVLSVTHDPLEALRLGDRLLVMSGRPARLSPPMTPAGTPPRPVDDPSLLVLQGELLRRLAEGEP